jgi:hypothetical protein
MVKLGLIPYIVLVGLVMMITVTYWEAVLDLTGNSQNGRLVEHRTSHRSVSCYMTVCIRCSK